MSVVAELHELTASRELLSNLTLRELRGKYKRTALGWGWSLVNPLSSMVIFTLVFGVLFRIRPPVGAGGLRNYALFLLCGLLPWTFLSNGMTAGMASLVANGNLIKKTYFRREMLVAANVLAFGVTFLIEMGVLAAAFLAFGTMVLPWLPVALFVMALLTLFVLGLALALSVLNVYFRDAAHFVAIFLQLWFYATPVLYPIGLVAAQETPGSFAARVHLLTLYEVNPMVGFVEALRDALYQGRFPSWPSLGYVTAVSVGTLALGAALFRRLEGRLAEEL